MFTRSDGQQYHPNTLTKTFADLAVAAGLPAIRLHDLRHTHVAHLIAADTHLKIVSDRVGQVSTSFTMDRYGHLTDGQQRDAATKVAKLINDSAP